MVMKNQVGGDLPLFSKDVLDDYKASLRTVPLYVQVPAHLLATKDAAKFLGMSRSVVNRAILAGTFAKPTFELVTRNGKGIRGFELSDLLRWRAGR